MIEIILRSPYFKTALNTDVGSNNQSSRKRTKGIQNLEVKECSPEVLSITIKFIYGIALPEDLEVEDAKNLLTIADLYLMGEISSDLYGT